MSTSMQLDPEVRDVGEWIALCQELPPVELFGLIGLLSERPELPPSLARAAELQTAENIKGAKNWARRYFRNILQYYCGKRHLFEAAEKGFDEADAVKAIAISLFGLLNIKIGIIVASIFIILKLKGNKWCDKYAGMRLTGQGPYEGNFAAQPVSAFFEIEYLPPIVEKVENPAAYPLKIKVPVIEVDKEIKGRVKVPTRAQAEAIFYSFEGGGKIHKFSFNDIDSKQDVSGTLDSVSLGSDAKLGVFDFDRAELTLGSKRL